MNPYRERRASLHHMAGGAILLLGHSQTPRNYPSNAYPFRQNSHFLYYTGLSVPDMAVLITPDGEHRLYGDDRDRTAIMWEGPTSDMSVRGAQAGFDKTVPLEQLSADIDALLVKGQIIHYPPPVRAQTILWLATLLRCPVDEVSKSGSELLNRIIAAHRSAKDDGEVTQIEQAVEITARVIDRLIEQIEPGQTEQALLATVYGTTAEAGAVQGFSPIVTVHGEVLHNSDTSNTLTAGDLILVDTGAERPSGYSSDITRTFPVSGVFTDIQRAVYQLVLDAQLAAIDTIGPGVSNIEVHQMAAMTIISGLKEIGLMKGSCEEAVELGAHALFYPHGIGHLLGLDTHDMEDLGDLVGYPEGTRRSSKPGLKNLRLGRPLEPGFVVTCEPGIYFIPALIDAWRAENRHQAFIDYGAVEQFRNFGGIRIEDDILVTKTGRRILGPPIPKTIEEIEALFAKKRRNRN